MGDEDEAALEAVDGVGEGVDGLHVEVVGRLVEEQHVRRLPRQPREHHATPLPVGQLLDRTGLQGKEMIAPSLVVLLHLWKLIIRHVWHTSTR